MIPQVLLKLLLPKILDHLMKVFKLDKLLDYMELPNDADRRIDELEKEIELLKGISHPPVIDAKRLEGIEEKLAFLCEIDVVELYEEEVEVIDDSQAGDA
tara:strand:+ start:1119 stop:1418 length:300 start_codon:yes stop_codon:yes gene_type:complete